MSLTEGDLEAIAVSEDVVEKRRLPCAEKPESTVPGSLRAVVSVERFEPVFGSGHFSPVFWSTCTNLNA
jgi:hypothetical protein